MSVRNEREPPPGASHEVHDKHSLPPEDAAARALASDPTRNVVLEASAGTGKTSVLVARYLNLLRAGVEPSNVLAITFTRQAAAEMRERIITELQAAAEWSAEGRSRWADLRDRLGEITISTVDAFCLSLLREFPLEADLEPGFGMADETEIPSLIDDAVERTLTLGAGIARRDGGLAMLLAQLGPWRARVALIHLLRRRLVVPDTLHRFLDGTPTGWTAEEACRCAAERLVDRLGGVAHQVELLIRNGPLEDPSFAALAHELERLPGLVEADPSRIRATLDRLREFFLTRKGTPRVKFAPGRRVARQPEHRRYRAAAAALAPIVCDTLHAFERDLNVAMARAVQRLFGMAVSEYERTLEARGLLDFSSILWRAVDLLKQMDEFATSRYRLESRFQHVLVDEFQDTSRAQWQLVSLLVQSWGEGRGLGHEAPVPPSIFIVGDRKQSIYRFRDADVAVLQDAAEEIAELRGDGNVSCSIAHSFRSVPGLLGFANDLFAEVGKVSGQRDAFRYDAKDRFPLPDTQLEDKNLGSGALALDGEREPPLGVVVADDIESCADAVAGEVERLIEGALVRDPHSGIRRRTRPGDVAILFRARASHREFEWALERRAIPACVYKGLGFFDADEIKDVRVLIRFLADPQSELRAAALLRSRFVRVSDPGLLTLAGCLSVALVGADALSEFKSLRADDRLTLERVRASLTRWLPLVDRLPPAEVLDIVLSEGAYAYEMRGPQAVQARENLKKLRSLVRRLQNRGYATMAHVADHIDHLSGDVSNATVDTFDAVNLMTVHAAKGLEFPIVFLVDLGRGTATKPPAIRIIPDRGDGRPAVTIWPFRSEADENERQRELEETKRLLYVAVTRARDRLYLSSLVEADHPKFNRGSLGEVLPGGLASVFEGAVSTRAGSQVQWRGQSGVEHLFRVCRPAGEIESDETVKRIVPSPAPLKASDDNFSPLQYRPRLVREPVTAGATIAGETPGRQTAAGKEEARHRVIGRLVHELVRHEAARPSDRETARRAARELLRTREALDAGAADEIADAAAGLWARLIQQPDLAALLVRDCLFEVPFSLRPTESGSPDAEGGPPRVLRGTIDCLVRHSGGDVTVLEFKTGRPRHEHRHQLAVYVSATRAMFPEASVKGRLIYAGE